MKKLHQLLLGALFIAFALNATAQTEVSYKESHWPPFVINCNGVEDIISGTQYCQLIHHYNPKTGAFEWFINKWKAELVSEVTSEVFTVNYRLKGITDGSFNETPDLPDGNAYYKIRYNARGNMGSHYLVTETVYFDFSTGTFSTIERTVKCK